MLRYTRAHGQRELCVTYNYNKIRKKMDALGASKNEKSKSKSERIGGGQLPAMAIHHYTCSHH